VRNLEDGHIFLSLPEADGLLGVLAEREDCLQAGGPYGVEEAVSPGQLRGVPEYPKSL
jgi:hypothetical protein